VTERLLNDDPSPPFDRHGMVLDMKGHGFKSVGRQSQVKESVSMLLDSCLIRLPFADDFIEFLKVSTRIVTSLLILVVFPEFFIILSLLPFLHFGILVNTRPDLLDRQVRSSVSDDDSLGRKKPVPEQVPFLFI
jgi:hypothetical protein